MHILRIIIMILVKKKLFIMKEEMICIIPARQGSKRIKNKNILKFFKKPIIVIATVSKSAVN